MYSYFDPSCDQVILNDKPLNCLMYADDMILLSSTVTGLQNSINKLWKFADDWHMNINCGITKIVVFTINITFNSTPLECVQKYTYLGITFSASGTFSYAKENIYKKGMKALFKLRKSFENDKPIKYKYYFTYF